MAKTKAAATQTAPVSKPVSTKKAVAKAIPAKKASKKEDLMGSENSHGFAKVKDVLPITAKNVKTQQAREMSLRDFVLGALVGNPELSNEEVFALVTKAGRDNAQSTTEWYAARVRQGHIKAVK